MKKPEFKLFCILIVSITMFCITGCSDGSSDAGINTGYNPGDGLKLRFAALGDNQVGTAAWLETQATNPSSANLPQLRQSMIDMSNASPGPELIFFAGDLVINEAKDNGETLRAQLKAWQDFYGALPVTGRLPLLPVPGNHELDFADPALNAEAPNPGAIDEWLRWFVQEGYDFAAGNGPTPSGANPDSLVRDESKLTYSFNRGDIHFIVINTDTLSTKTDATTGLALTGWIALHWIEEDIRKAQLDPSISTIIAVGHKPIQMPPFAAESDTIINTSQYPLAERLSLVMKENSKVKLYLASHNHSWDSIKLNNGEGIQEVLVGNGGAPPAAQWNPPGGIFFGYSLIDVFESGKIVLHSYGRVLPPPPQKFYEGAPVAPEPATLREDMVIYSP